MKKNNFTLFIDRLLSTGFQNSVAVIGLGNRDRSDDGIGLYIAEQLKKIRPVNIHTEEERNVEGLVWDAAENERIKTVLFFDAVNGEMKPGEILIISKDNAERLVQPFSTHKVPAAVIMKLLLQAGKIPYIIGIQPFSLEFMGEMSLECRNAAHFIVMQIAKIMNKA